MTQDTLLLISLLVKSTSTNKFNDIMRPLSKETEECIERLLSHKNGGNQ